MDATLQHALSEWRAVRAKTLEFIEDLPADQMSWRPHEQLGTFGMQLRHLGKIQEAYVIGMKTGVVTFLDRPVDPAVETDKAVALAHLERLDADMVALVQAFERRDIRIVLRGSGEEQQIDLVTVLWHLIEHETYHQGIFTCYGRLAGLGKFVFL